MLLLTRAINRNDISTALGFRDYMLMLVLLDTGIRVSELCGVTLDDLHEGSSRSSARDAKSAEAGGEHEAENWVLRDGCQ
jgi:site-specific recombinase XerD